MRPVYTSEYALVAVILAGAVVWLFNSYRLGRFSSKRTDAADPKGRKPLPRALLVLGVLLLLAALVLLLIW
ncbi:MAG: hypothetical protein IJD21_02630 [Oscillospiraceae bacterium]|nr:hypothetical protein [Oscillospiraceae bacterium]